MVERASSASQFVTMTKYAFLNYFRSRRFFVLVAIVLLMGGALSAAVAYFRPPSVVGLGTTSLDLYNTFWGGGIDLVGLVVLMSVAFFGGDAISGEFQNKTGYFLVPNPIRRSVLYTGKWVAALGASTLILLVFAVFPIANGLYYYGSNVPWQFGESFFFAWMYLVAALGLTFMFSSLFKSSAISIMMTVVLLLFVFGIVDLISSTFAGIEPWFSLVYGAGIISSVMHATYPPHMQVIQAGPRFTLTMYYATVEEGIIILLAYFVVSALLGLWIFEKREFSS